MYNYGYFLCIWCNLYTFALLLLDIIYRFGKFFKLVLLLTRSVVKCGEFFILFSFPCVYERIVVPLQCAKTDVLCILLIYWFNKFALAFTCDGTWRFILWIFVFHYINF